MRITLPVLHFATIPAPPGCLWPYRSTVLHRTLAVSVVGHRAVATGTLLRLAVQIQVAIGLVCGTALQVVTPALAFTREVFVQRLFRGRPVARDPAYRGGCLPALVRRAEPVQVVLRPAGQQFGFAVATLGPDPLTAASDPSLGQEAGRVEVFGPDGSLAWSLAGLPGEELGFSLAATGDLTGDGQSDLAAGAPSTSPALVRLAGRAVARDGRTGAALWQVAGGAVEEQAGWSVAAAGDIDGDGHPDVAVGAPSASPEGRHQAGSVFVLSGANGSLIRRLDGPEPGLAFGFAVAGGRDVDGDGVPDLLVGAIGASPGGMPCAGSAFLIAGATGQILRRLDGPAPGASFGYAVLLAPDLDGDGVPELVVGAPGMDRPGRPMAGAAFVYSGRTGTEKFRILGEAPFASLGTSLAALEGVHNGRPALLVGSPFGAPEVPTPGEVLMVDGGTGRVPQRILPPDPAGGARAEFGFALAAQGSRMAVGAPGSRAVAVFALGPLALELVLQGVLSVTVEG